MSINLEISCLDEDNIVEDIIKQEPLQRGVKELVDSIRQSNKLKGSLCKDEAQLKFIHKIDFHKDKQTTYTVRQIRLAFEPKIQILDPPYPINIIDRDYLL